MVLRCLYLAFEWYLASLIVKNISSHQNNMCYNKIGLSTQNIWIIINLGTQLRLPMWSFKKKGYHHLTSCNFCISTPVLKWRSSWFVNANRIRKFPSRNNSQKYKRSWYHYTKVCWGPACLCFNLRHKRGWAQLNNEQNWEHLKRKKNHNFEL